MLHIRQEAELEAAEVKMLSYFLARMDWFRNENIEGQSLLDVLERLKLKVAGRRSGGRKKRRCTDAVKEDTEYSELCSFFCSFFLLKYFKHRKRLTSNWSDRFFLFL